jgi:hypothetical protein
MESSSYVSGSGIVCSVLDTGTGWSKPTATAGSAKLNQVLVLSF